MKLRLEKHRNSILKSCRASEGDRMRANNFYPLPHHSCVYCKSGYPFVVGPAAVLFSQCNKVSR